MALTIFLRLFMTEAMLVSPLSLSTDRSWNINGMVARDQLTHTNLNVSKDQPVAWGLHCKKN